MNDFDSKLAFPDCNSSLNSQTNTKLCTKIEGTKKRSPIAFRSHPINFKVTRAEKSAIWLRFERFGTITPTNGYQMMHIAFRNMEDFPDCFWGHPSNYMGRKIDDWIRFEGGRSYQSLQICLVAARSLWYNETCNQMTHYETTTSLLCQNDAAAGIINKIYSSI